jgi:hypothetical protein
MTILLRDRFSSFNKVVIPAGAYPDFLLRSASHRRCAAFLKESRMKFANATKPDRKSGVA